MWPLIIKNIIGLGLPFILGKVGKPIGKAVGAVTPVSATGSRTAAFGTGVAWLGIVAQIITSLDALPGLEGLIGAQGGTILAVLGILIRAYREITTGPMR